MAEALKVWGINGYDDEGSYTIDLYSTYEKAKNVFNEIVEERNMLYGGYDEYRNKYESVCCVNEDYASYDCGSHHGSFWIEEVDIK